VQGNPQVEAPRRYLDWGAVFTDEQAVELAERCGFEPRYRHGAGTQYFWLWFFKTGEPQSPAGSE
jgi:hypothetical protein